MVKLVLTVVATSSSSSLKIIIKVVIFYWFSIFIFKIIFTCPPAAGALTIAPMGMSFRLRRTFNNSVNSETSTIVKEVISVYNFSNFGELDTELPSGCGIVNGWAAEYILKVL